MKTNEIWHISALSRRGVVIAVLICLFAFVVRAWCVGFPADTYFDEIYYGPAALNYIEGRFDSNTVHPPLGKIQIAAGILGTTTLTDWWGSELYSEHVQRRAASVIAGTLMVVFTFMLAHRVSKGSQTVALLAAFLIAIDFMAVVMSRVCMLDAINALWILIGVYCCWRYLEECWRESSYGRWWAFLCALSLGVATACKWNGLFAIGACWLAMVLFRNRFWGISADAQKPEDSAKDNQKQVGYIRKDKDAVRLCRPGIKTIWREGWKPGLQLAGLFFVVSFVVYIASYIPLFLRMGIGAQAWREIWGYHTLMFSFRYDAKQFTHSYISYFWEWPLIIRPIWLYFETGAKGAVNGIIAFGSVLFWWPVLVYMAESLYYGIKRSEVMRLFLVLMWLVQWLLWASSTTGGFIYYMLPVVPFMAIVAAIVLNDWQYSGGSWMAALYLAALSAFFVLYWDFLSGQDTTMAHFARMFPSWATRWR